MRGFRGLLSGLVVATLAGAPAIAADFGAGATALPMAVGQVEPPADAAFDWGGWYFGGYTATTIPLPPGFGAVLGGFAGYDWTRNRFVGGVALSAHIGLGQFDRREVQLNVRGGGLLTDRLLAYVRVGAGVGQHFVPFSRVYFYYGAGAEFAMRTDWTVFTEFGGLYGVGGGLSEWVMVGGFTWRPDR